MASDLAIRLFQGINEPWRSFRGVLTQIVINCLIDIPVSSFTRYDGLGFTEPAWLRRLDFATQAIEVGFINRLGLRRSAPASRRPRELQTILDLFG